MDEFNERVKSIADNDRHQAYQFLCLLDDWCSAGEFYKLIQLAQLATDDPYFIEQRRLGLTLINMMCHAIKKGDMQVSEGQPFYDFYKAGREKQRGKKDVAKLLRGYAKTFEQ